MREVSQLSSRGSEGNAIICVGDWQACGACSQASPVIQQTLCILCFSCSLHGSSLISFICLKSGPPTRLTSVKVETRSAQVSPEHSVARTQVFNNPCLTNPIHLPMFSSNFISTCLPRSSPPLKCVAFYVCHPFGISSVDIFPCVKTLIVRCIQMYLEYATLNLGVHGSPLCTQHNL